MMNAELCFDFLPSKPLAGILRQAQDDNRWDGSTKRIHHSKFNIQNHSSDSSFTNCNAFGNVLIK